MNLVQITVGQGPYVTIRFTNRRINARVLPEDVVLAQNRHHHIVLQDLDRSARYKVQRRQHVALVDQRVSRRGVRRLELER